jgi:hypothetical protein
MPLFVVGIVAVSTLVGYIPYAVFDTNAKLQTYVIPRTLTKSQADMLVQTLSKHEHYTATVKVNPLDAEAREYAEQVFNALDETDWDVDFDTSSGDPNTLHDGLCVDERGVDSKPKYDSKSDPREILEHAFEEVRIEISCSNMESGSEYKLYVLVGHRPLTIGNRMTILQRLGQWLMEKG